MSPAVKLKLNVLRNIICISKSISKKTILINNVLYLLMLFDLDGGWKKANRSNKYK